jgi:hypothetical protein
MAEKRLGAASVTVSISDADGFRVVHADGSILKHIPAENLHPSDWERFWSGINAVENAAAWRQIDKTKQDKA